MLGGWVWGEKKGDNICQQRISFASPILINPRMVIQSKDDLLKIQLGLLGYLSDRVKIPRIEIFFDVKYFLKFACYN